MRNSTGFRISVAEVFSSPIAAWHSVIYYRFNANHTTSWRQREFIMRFKFIPPHFVVQSGQWSPTYHKCGVDPPDFISDCKRPVTLTILQGRLLTITFASLLRLVFVTWVQLLLHYPKKSGSLRRNLTALSAISSHWNHSISCFTPGT